MTQSSSSANTSARGERNDGDHKRCCLSIHDDSNQDRQAWRKMVERDRQGHRPSQGGEVEIGGLKSVVGEQKSVRKSENGER